MENRAAHRVFDLMASLKKIESELDRMGRQMRYETKVDEDFHAYAKKHGLVGRSYEEAYNEWMKKAGLDYLMIDLD